MRYIIFITLIIFIFCFSGIALAEEKKAQIVPDVSRIDILFQKIDQKLVEPVKQGIENFPQRAEETTKNIIESIKKEQERKKEEIKQGIKERIKKEVREEVEKWKSKIKDWLAPLKNKIQQGSDIVRGWLNKVKNFFIDLF